MAQTRPFWLVQAKCLSHYKANQTSPGEYERDPSLGKGDVMHLTCVTPEGETAAIYVPGVFHCKIWRPLDGLDFDDFSKAAGAAFSEAPVLKMDEFESTPVFGDGKPCTFYRLRFSARNEKSVREMSIALSEMLEGQIEKCESKYTPEARFVDERDISFCGWFQAKNLVTVFPMHKKTNEALEYVCKPEDIAPDNEREGIPPLKMISFDIETKNKVWDENVIPLPDNKDSSIYSVAVTTHFVGNSKPIDAYYVLVRPPKAPSELTEEFLLEKTKFTDVTIVKDERRLIRRFNDILQKESPIFITGHNIIKYDLPFVVSRATRLSKRWGRRKGHIVSYRSIQRDSGGLGKNDTFVFDTDRIILDLYPYMKENEKGLEDNKLNTIAKAILPQGGAGRKKIEVRYEDQFKIYTESEKLDEHLLLAEYVYTDADLVPDILTTYTAVEKLIASSQVAKTPLEKMLGGQQVRAYHAIVHEAHRQGKIVNAPPDRQIQHYKGGYVQDPTPQVVMNFEKDGQKYFSTHTCLDFKSLYPSLMRQFALCFSHFKGGKDYQRLVDAYDIVEMTERAEDILKKAQRIHKVLEESIEKARFAQVEKNRKILEDLQKQLEAIFEEAFAVAGERLSDHYFYETAKQNLENAKKLKDITELEVPLELHLPVFRNEEGGILPTLIGRYMTERTRYKKKMKAAYKKASQAETPEEKAKWSAQHAHSNSAQLAVKVMVNSLYGFTGVRPPKAQLPLVALAATTTCAGRWSIKQTQRLSQEKHSIEVEHNGAHLKVYFTTDFDELERWEKKDGEEMVYTDMIYGDTDSIMPKICFKQPSVLDERLFFEKMMEVETERINVELRRICAEMGYDRPFLILEFEKHGAMLVKGPKMYALNKHEPGKPPKISVSGLKPARRDNAPLLKELFMDVLKTRLVENNPTATVKSIVSWLKKVEKNEFAMDAYHITTAIGRNYKNPNLLQPMLQRKIREHGGVCDSGDRVHYVVTRNGHKVAEKAEGPEYCTLEDIDRVWYIKNHVQDCILELCDIFKDIKSEFVRNLFGRTCVAIEQADQGQSQIQAFFKPSENKPKPRKRKAEVKAKPKLKQSRISFGKK